MSLFEDPAFTLPGAEPNNAAEADVAPATDVDQRPVFPSPAAPLDVARRLYDDHYREDDLPTLVALRGTLMRWSGPHWAEVDKAEIRSTAYEVLGEVDFMRPIMEKGVIVDYEHAPWNPNRQKVADVLEAMAAVGHVSSDVDPPAWLAGHDGIHGEVPAAQIISCTNGLLDRGTRKLDSHTPALFNVVSVPFDYDQNAPKPVAWLEFLQSIWHGDQDSIDLLQEFVGYVISGSTDMQKLLLLIGPTRSGKGTIARVLTLLVGPGHVAGPTLASLGTNFGLSPLLGKPLAIVADARLGEAPAHTVVERLLSITGEDMLTVDRKFRDPWSGRIPSRFVILSNELPRFRDASGAIANRMLILQMTNSFLGREDRTLDGRLRAELPGILNWALDGLDRLHANGVFTVPSASEDATASMADLASPVAAFVRERCVRGPQESVQVDRLYFAWKSWAEDQGHMAGAKNTFGRNLRAVVPEAKITQPTVDGLRVKTYAHIGLTHGQCTGCGIGANDANPLVNGRCTGCTGSSPLWASAEQRSTCESCGRELIRPASMARGCCEECERSKGTR